MLVIGKESSGSQNLSVEGNTSVEVTWNELIFLMYFWNFLDVPQSDLKAKGFTSEQSAWRAVVQHSHLDQPAVLARSIVDS